MSYLRYQYTDGVLSPIFKITNIISYPPTTNLPPVITGLSGPTVLKVGESGTFKINAYDPENKTLYYSIHWGDDPVTLFSDYYGAQVPSQNIATQNSTYTHSYASAGAYIIYAEVSDEKGNLATSTITVKVVNNTGLKVISPNGGEYLYRYGYATIYWSDTNEPVNIYVSDIHHHGDVYPCNDPPGYSCLAGTLPLDTMIFSNIQPDANSDSDYIGWSVGSTSKNYIPDGPYRIKVCGTTKCDYSDSDWYLYSIYPDPQG